MKNGILREKLRQFLVKKFIYMIIEQYIDHYNKGNNDKNNILDKIKKIEKSKRMFKQYLIKNSFNSFLAGVHICINNQRIQLIRDNFIISNRINNIRN